MEQETIREKVKLAMNILGMCAYTLSLRLGIRYDKSLSTEEIQDWLDGKQDLSDDDINKITDLMSC